MSIIVESVLGRLRKAAAAPAGWLLECPGCREWLPLSPEMFRGEISVNHLADGCPGGYHETHDFREALASSPTEDR